MSRLLNLDNILVHSKKKTFLKYNNLKNCFETEDKNRFDIINGIPDFFMHDIEKLSLTQSNFYNEVKFPNYDEIDDFLEGKEINIEVEKNLINRFNMTGFKRRMPMEFS